MALGNEPNKQQFMAGSSLLNEYVLVGRTSHFEGNSNGTEADGHWHLLLRQSGLRFLFSLGKSSHTVANTQLLDGYCVVFPAHGS